MRLPGGARVTAGEPGESSCLCREQERRGVTVLAGLGADLCRQATRQGLVRRSLGLIALAQGEHGGDQRDDHQQRERGHAATGQASSPAVLADVLALEFILGHTVHRGGEVGDGGAEPAVAQVEVGLAAGPAEVEVPRLFADRGLKALGHRVADEAAGIGVPAPLAAGQRRQDPICRLGLEPVGELTVDPGRPCRFRGGQEHEPIGLVQRGDDRAPEVRIGREAGLVTEDPQCPRPVPGLGQTLEARLQCRGQPAVGRMAIRNEAVVGHRSLPRPP